MPLGYLRQGHVIQYAVLEGNVNFQGVLEIYPEVSHCNEPKGENRIVYVIF